MPNIKTIEGKVHSLVTGSQYLIPTYIHIKDYFQHYSTYKNAFTEIQEP